MEIVKIRLIPGASILLLVLGQVHASFVSYDINSTPDDLQFGAMSGQSNASENLTYVEGSKPFVTIEDVNRQGEAWAACAASYDILARFLDETPAQSQQLKDRANGAKLAVGMTLVLEDLDSDISPERFNALWTFAKVAIDAWPETQRNAILEEAESLSSEGAEGSNKFVDKLIATVKICNSNLESQQMYIDVWRAFAKSGM